ncbi:hypothetical protein Sjap_019008 [Stephania japonica]|uniref:Uncharacterized protein n=1 Tax=Stephania japonica TaxID=461633 RepID=A0AAP0F6W0_9MAGN
MNRDREEEEEKEPRGAQELGSSMEIAWPRLRQFDNCLIFNTKNGKVMEHEMIEAYKQQIEKKEMSRDEPRSGGGRREGAERSSRAREFDGDCVAEPICNECMKNKTNENVHQRRVVSRVGENRTCSRTNFISLFLYHEPKQLTNSPPPSSHYDPIGRRRADPRTTQPQIATRVHHNRSFDGPDFVNHRWLLVRTVR